MALGQALSECRELGFELPLHVAVLAVNGAAYVFTYTAIEGAGGPLRAELLAQHSAPDKTFVLPINIMICDARGEAARVYVGKDGQVYMQGSTTTH